MAALNLILYFHSFSRGCLEFNIAKHPKIDDILVISAHDKDMIDLNDTNIVPHSKEVIVDEFCGVAVLSGADVYACGILGAPPGNLHVPSLIFRSVSSYLRACSHGAGWLA